MFHTTKKCEREKCDKNILKRFRQKLVKAQYSEGKAIGSILPINVRAE